MTSVPELHTVEEAADLLKISPKTLRRWISEGKAECTRIAGHSIRFTPEQLQALLEVDNG